MVLEGWWAVPGGRRLGDPQLDAVDLASIAAGALFGVGHAVAGGHEVELAGRDDLLGAERVAVQRFARQQPGDGLQADVGMRRDAETAFVDGRGAHVVDEAPRTDGASSPAGQRAAHRERSDLAGCGSR